jgi:hypothetical protein
MRRSNPRIQNKLASGALALSCAAESRNAGSSLLFPSQGLQ